MYPVIGIGWPKISGIGIGCSQFSGIGWNQSSGIGWNFGIGTSLLICVIFIGQLIQSFAHKFLQVVGI